MLRTEIYERSPMRVFDASVQGGLDAGELGAILGSAGVGKSALLVHIALDRIMHDQRVLHVSMRSSAEHVRSFYDEIFQGVSRMARFKTEDRLAVQVERNRMIHSYLNRDFGVKDLDAALELLSEVMQFRPTCLMLDGFDGDLYALSEFAQRRALAIWIVPMNGQTHPVFKTVVSLNPARAILSLKAARIDGDEEGAPMGLELDPTTLLIKGEDTWDPATAPGPQNPADCTLYSGGANGSETVFGELSERFGLQEINFSFEGHAQGRTRGRKLLNERELAAGDVSLLYVSRRLKRNYSKESEIRKVLQSIWHQVSWSDQIFVIGLVQEDGTVVGGTGWAVELARMWRKNLWVYDQDKGVWFRWINESWAPGVPVIEAARFCGTGTRNIKTEGRQAIEELFERSFGAC
jgi:hypothetical protein